MSRGETENHSDAARLSIMAVLAQARADDIENALSELGDAYRFDTLRPAETGLVMLRGRIGGDGAPFNVGEATVTRAAVQLDSGEIGFSYVLGRDGRKATLAALCDALWQSDSYRDAVERDVVAPLRTAQDKQRTLRQQQTAATRVDFFTLVRGEDQK